MTTGILADVFCKDKYLFVSYEKINRRNFELAVLWCFFVLNCHEISTLDLSEVTLNSKLFPGGTLIAYVTSKHVLRSNSERISDAMRCDAMRMSENVQTKCDRERWIATSLFLKYLSVQNRKAAMDAEHYK